MSDKKAGRRPKSGHEKVKEFVNHLAEYDDFSQTKLDHPKYYPRRFSLKIGNRVVGRTFIDWKEVFGVFFDLAAKMAKPANLSADEYVAQLETHLKTLSPSNQQELSVMLLGSVWHMLEFVPQKLNEALTNLALESRQRIVMQNQQKLGASMPSAAKFADYVARVERKSTLRRLPELRGGTRKTKLEWRNPDTKKRYAELANTRKLLAECVKNMFDECEHADDWIDDLRNDSNFQILSAGIANNIINSAIKRVADDGLPTREREPLAVALEIAREELGLPKQKIETLRGYYSTGSGLSRKDRNARKAANPPTS